MGKEVQVDRRWLVIWRQNMDDIPIRLCSSWQEAEFVAKDTTFTHGYRLANEPGLSCSTPVCFAVIEFLDGFPRKIHYIEREDDV